ncbi:hypothetical protein NED98_10975 [Sphingomonas sp. MMSM20]|uniref:hypothetical protein n=1 Tax=Sphingomonas lycopersici TaxID=2951807 RepID=UPI002237A15B|nr:hypothetical protein [Sphingomonas lycopersici]MCW6530766.1 hypothetical protein [Sphingomonas lycopersici]
MGIIVLMDTLGIENAVMAGFDSIARTTNFVAAFWPRHCKALVSECGFLIGSQELETTRLPLNARYQWQYQYYFGIERGAAGCARYAHDFARLTWELVSLPCEFHDTTFAQSASALDNPDHVAMTIHNYRRSPGLAHGKRKSDGIERKLAVFSASPSRPSRSRVSPMARRIPIRPLTPGVSPSATSTDCSPLLSGTIHLGHRRANLPEPSSTRTGSWPGACSSSNSGARARPQATRKEGPGR